MSPVQLTDYQAQYFAYELTRRAASDSPDRLASAVAGAQVDLNPHQVDAALFAFKSPLSKGALLADEVGLGKRSRRDWCSPSIGPHASAVSSSSCLPIDALFVSLGTVKVHVTHFLAKLDVKSRSAATDYALRHNLAWDIFGAVPGHPASTLVRARS